MTRVPGIGDQPIEPGPGSTPGRAIERATVLLVGVAAWFLLAGFGCVVTGIRPKSALGWLVMLVLGPVIWVALSVAGEAAGEGIHRLPGVRQVREAVQLRSVGKSFSGLRILYLLVELLLTLGLVAGLLYLLGLI